MMASPSASALGVSMIQTRSSSVTAPSGSTSTTGAVGGVLATVAVLDWTAALSSKLSLAVAMT